MSEEKMDVERGRGADEGQRKKSVVSVQSKTLCCMIFYIATLQPLLRCLSEMEWNIGFIEAVRQGGEQFAFALSTLLFYTKIVIDDLIDRECNMNRTDIKESDGRSRNRKPLMFLYFFAWLFFALQATVLDNIEFSGICFVMGVVLITAGLFKEGCHCHRQKWRIVVNVVCAILSAIGCFCHSLIFIGLFGGFGLFDLLVSYLRARPCSAGAVASRTGQMAREVMPDIVGFIKK